MRLWIQIQLYFCWKDKYFIEIRIKDSRYVIMIHLCRSWYQHNFFSFLCQFFFDHHRLAAAIAALVFPLLQFKWLRCWGFCNMKRDSLRYILILRIILQVDIWTKLYLMLCMELLDMETKKIFSPARLGQFWSWRMWKTWCRHNGSSGGSWDTSAWRGCRTWGTPAWPPWTGWTAAGGSGATPDTSPPAPDIFS